MKTIEFTLRSSRAAYDVIMANLELANRMNQVHSCMYEYDEADEEILFDHLNANGITDYETY